MARLVVITNPYQSGEIRGRQVAERLRERGRDVEVDPPELKRDDTVLCVKSMLKDDAVAHVQRMLMDVVDSPQTLEWLKTHESVEIVSIGLTHEAYMRELYPGRKVWLLPEHHCNREGVRVRLEQPRVVGYCGTVEGLQLDAKTLAAAIAPLGYELILCYDPPTREDVCRFYRCIDVQLCWRPSLSDLRLKNPLKLANAGSFGVPTIAYPEPSYVEECGGEFLPALKLEDVLTHLRAFRERGWTWRNWSDIAFQLSGRYSLERVASLYESVLWPDGEIGVSSNGI